VSFATGSVWFREQKTRSEVVGCLGEDGGGCSGGGGRNLGWVDESWRNLRWTGCCGNVLLLSVRCGATGVTGAPPSRSLSMEAPRSCVRSAAVWCVDVACGPAGGWLLQASSGTNVVLELCCLDTLLPANRENQPIKGCCGRVVPLSKYC
jgi:hypothetical protein